MEIQEQSTALLLRALTQVNPVPVPGNGHRALPALDASQLAWAALFPDADIQHRTAEQDATWKSALRSVLTDLGLEPRSVQVDGLPAWYYLSADEAELAFEHKGNRAAVHMPHMGQAHQQYFSPRCVAEAFLAITDVIFERPDYAGTTLSVADLTCGTGRLLAPFRDACHRVLGIELDARVAATARRALGPDNVRQGDVMAYAPLLRGADVDVVAINPPYALWWPKTDDFPWEMAGYENIESQHAVLEIATHAVRTNGLLLALFSGSFWDSNPKALAYLKQKYQLVLRAHIPQPFKREYGIDVDGSVVVAIRRDTTRYTPKWEAPEGAVCQDKDALVSAVAEAWQTLRNAEYRTDYGYHHPYLPDRMWALGRMPVLPHLDLTVQVDTSTPQLQITARGIRAQSDWAGAWLSFYANTVPAYDDAQWTVTNAVEAYGSLPNLLLAGTEMTTARWKALGFQPEVQHGEQITRAAERYRREDLPLADLSPMEYLGYVREGWYTVRTDVSVTPHDADQPVTLKQGQRCYVKPGWIRSTALADTDVKPDGVTLRTYLDTGFMRFRVQPEEGNAFDLTENRQEEVGALIGAFGLPEVPTALSLPDSEKWERSLAKTMDRLAAKNGGVRLYDFQAQDVVRAATKPFLALLYEQGGGKTATFAHWAALRGYRRVLVVCQSSLVPNWQQELAKFGFPTTVLRHGTISKIKQQLRAERRARREADPEQVRAYHRKRRHLNNLLDIQARGKARDPEALNQEIIATRAELGALPYDPQPETQFYVVSYEALSLSDPVYDPWQCEHFNRDGDLVETITNTGKACSVCGTEFTRAVTYCPKCRAEKPLWKGTHCDKCGHFAFTFGHGAGDEGSRQFAYVRRIRRLFGAVGVDEAQLAKNVKALRGQAVHSLKARGKALLTGTLMRGYVTDVYWNVGWLLGHGGPLWPFPHQGGARRFLAQFGTFEYVTKEFADTLSTGKRKQIPSVSNLVRLWRLLAPAAIRRLKTDVLSQLPEKHRHVVWVEPGEAHGAIAAQVEAIAQDAIATELRVHPDDPCMGVISRSLWWARYAAACRDENGLPYYSEAFGIDLRPDLPKEDAELLALYRTLGGEDTPHDVRQAIQDHVRILTQRLVLDGKALPVSSGFPKVRTAVDLVREAHQSREKTIIFTSLRALLNSTVHHLKKAGLTPTVITAETPARKRLEVIRAFGEGDSPVLVAGLNVLNRGFTITAANHVILLNVEWSPEDTLQAEDRVHRPGQTRDVHVHYLLTPGTVEEDMYQLISAKDAAQRSVTDKLARDRSVADLLSRAASAQLQVAQRMVQRRTENPTPVVIAPAQQQRPKPKPAKRPVPTVGVQLSLFEFA